jgi:hypothetical protein
MLFTRRTEMIGPVAAHPGGGGGASMGGGGTTLSITMMSGCGTSRSIVIGGASRSTATSTTDASTTDTSTTGGSVASSIGGTPESVDFSVATISSS